MSKLTLEAGKRPLPLKDVRVLDISQVMAGPYACMLLGDLGADVIKIEPPGAGDQTRGSMGFKMKGADSLGFLNMNRNKRGIALDLKTEAGKQVLKTLAKDADILVENYRPGALRRLGLSYDVLKEINPRLVYTSISGFGQTGPWADRPGFDLMAQAMSGVMSVTGYPDSPPVKCGVPVADIGCALFAIYATLAAYIGAKNTGQGQYIDAALFDTAIAFSVWDTCDWWGTRKPPQPLGISNKMTAPYQAMACADGYFVMGANNQKLWVHLQASGPRGTGGGPALHHDRATPGESARAARGTGEDLPHAGQGLLGGDAAGQRQFRPVPSCRTRKPSAATTRRCAACAWRSTIRWKARFPTSASRSSSRARRSRCGAILRCWASTRRRCWRRLASAVRLWRACASKGLSAHERARRGAAAGRRRDRVRHFRPARGAQRDDLGDVRTAARHLRAAA